MKSARTQNWLAKQLKVSQPRVCKLLKHELWRWGKTGWTDAQVREIRKWLTALRADNNATTNEPAPASTPAAAENFTGADVDTEAELRSLPVAKRAQVRLAIRREANLQLEQEIKLGGYLKRQDVERAWVGYVQSVRRELGNIRLLAVKLEAADLLQREKILEEWAMGVCRKFEQEQG